MKTTAVGIVLVTLCALEPFSAALAQGFATPGEQLYAQRVRIRPARVRVSSRGYEGFFGFTTYTFTEATSVTTTDRRGRARRAGLNPELAPFVARNFDRITEEMSEGAGEHLGAVAGLLGCEGEGQAAFARWAQAELPALLPDAATTPVTFLDNLARASATHPRFPAACGSPA